VWTYKDVSGIIVYAAARLNVSPTAPAVAINPGHQNLQSLKNPAATPQTTRQPITPRKPGAKTPERIPLLQCAPPPAGHSPL
jgi:hypothetical protein